MERLDPAEISNSSEAFGSCLAGEVRVGGGRFSKWADVKERMKPYQDGI